VSLLRACQFCGRRMRGVTPGAMTILLDGQPLDVAVVLCAEHGMEIRRVLDGLRTRSTVAQQAREVDVTQRLMPVADAVTEHFARAKQLITEDQYRHAALGQPLAVVPTPAAPRPRPRRNIASLRGWRQPQSPIDTSRPFD
jgi:hypothetical protein